MNHYSTADTVAMTHGWEVGKVYHKSGLGHKVLYCWPTCIWGFERIPPLHNTIHNAHKTFWLAAVAQTGP